MEMWTIWPTLTVMFTVVDCFFHCSLPFVYFVLWDIYFYLFIVCMLLCMKYVFLVGIILTLLVYRLRGIYFVRLFHR